MTKRSPSLSRCLLAACAVSALAGGSAAHGQASQAVTEASSAPVVPSLNRAPQPDQLVYSVGASQSVLFGYNGGSNVTGSTNVNGSAAYISGNQVHPTSFLYSGGYFFGDGNGQPSDTYQNLGISQQLVTPHFGLVFGDAASYLPNAPIFGLSGIVGVGDIGSQPIGLGGSPIDNLLTSYGPRVTNTISGSINAKLSEATSLNPYASYTIQRFLDGTGIDNNELDTGASLDHRIDPRNSAGGGYAYSRFTYLGNNALGFNVSNLRIDTHALNVRYEHLISRKLTFNGSVGPQWIESSHPELIPSRATVAGSGSLIYMAETTRYLLSYSRGTSTGTGVLVGTIFDNLNLTADHDFGRDWHAAFSANYGHARSIIAANYGQTNGNTLYGAVQLTRTLSRAWNAFGSYTLEHQTLSGPIVAYNAFSGTANIFSFGITYSPRPLHFHRGH